MSTVASPRFTGQYSIRGPLKALNRFRDVLAEEADKARLPVAFRVEYDQNALFVFTGKDAKKFQNNEESFEGMIDLPLFYWSNRIAPDDEVERAREIYRWPNKFVFVHPMFDQLIRARETQLSVFEDVMEHRSRERAQTLLRFDLETGQRLDTSV